MLINQSIMMANTRSEFYGRVTAFMLMAFAVQSVISPVWGVAADAIGGRETLFLVGAIVIGGTALMLPAWLKSRRLPDDAATAATAATEQAEVSGDEDLVRADE